MKTKEINRVLIIQTAFIGDVILATALIEKLAKETPGAKIDFLLRKGNEGLLENHPLLNEVLIWDKKKSKYLNLIKILKVLRKNRYDLLINLQRFLSTAFLTTFSKAKLTAGFSKTPLSSFLSLKEEHVIGDPQNYIHEIDRNQNLISSLLGRRTYSMCLYPNQEDYEAVQKYKKNAYYFIAPTSVWKTKEWPAHKWVELIHALPSEANVYLGGGPADTEKCQKIKESTKNNKVINLSGQLSFLESAALIKDAQMNFVNDSAPLHICSAMNAPVTCFFLSTVPAFGFGPLSDKQEIIEVRGDLECRPCGLHGHKECPKGHFDCAEKINIEDIGGYMI